MNRLVRAARSGSEEGFVRPDADDITAYVTGTATRQQVETVSAAMARSAAFRAEIIEMARDIDMLGDLDPLADKVRARRIVVPNRSAFLAGRCEPAVSRRKGDGLWGRLWRWRVPQVLVPVAVAASVLLVAVFRSTGPATVSLQLSQTLDRAVLISRTPRGVTEPVVNRSYATDALAAIAGFRSLLEFEDGEFRFKTTERLVVGPESRHDLAVTIVSDAGDERAKVSVSVSSDAPRSLKLWVLALEERALLYEGQELRSDRMRIVWPGGMDIRGCVAFTYHSEGGYRVAGIRAIDEE